jgi:hypothetical protein
VSEHRAIVLESDLSSMPNVLHCKQTTTGFATHLPLLQLGVGGAAMVGKPRQVTFAASIYHFVRIEGHSIVVTRANKCLYKRFVSSVLNE